MTEKARLCLCPEVHPSKKQELLREMKSAKVSDDGQLIRIGIIFHICYNDYNEKDVDEDIKYSINMLNKDYGNEATNFDNGKDVYNRSVFKSLYKSYVSKSGPSNIEFYYKQTIYKPMNQFKSGNIDILDIQIKGTSPAQSPENSLNIWVAELEGSLLGYAQFPWELKDKPNTDGVVIERGTFGRNPSYRAFDLNKTMTHEVGHWLGLYHVFQSTISNAKAFVDYVKGNNVEEFKGDCVVDTPSQGKPTSGNPLKSAKTWPRSKPSDGNKYNYHMFMNFMDYSDDISLFMFTKDQVKKMRLLINMNRPALVGQSNKEQLQEDEVEQIQEDDVEQSFNANMYDPIHYSFERNESYEQWSFNTGARVRNGNMRTGKRCLTSNKGGYAILTPDLSNMTIPVLSVWAKSDNPNAKIWIYVPEYNRWYASSLPKSGKYIEYPFKLPGPYNSKNGNDYMVAFGTTGKNNKYAYFDDMRILDAGNPSNRLNFEEDKN
jgi:hypothetical protein